MVELKRKGNTKVYSDSEHLLIVKLHNTEIVKVKWNDYIVLNSGGWQTQTTKRRMNQASIEYNLGFHVYQENYGWYVMYNDIKIPFADYMVLPKEIY